jgi:hypothetical protein
MAEHALYFNTSEPQFPFDKIRAKLTWLPDYLSTHMTTYNSDCYLNIILVFSRARTSALLTTNDWEEVRILTARLNAAAESVNASHHKLELLRCGGMFFITCRRSPRFQWTLPMSHYEVGRNLDYFAPGHISRDPLEVRYAVRFIERNSLSEIASEAVLLRYLDSTSVIEEFQRYNATREKLYNTAMEQLGLEYRVKCIIMTPDVLEDVALTMASPTPPSSHWWEDHCYIVNGFFFADVLVSTKFNFCGYQTRFVKYWPLIQLTFYFVLGYKRYEYCETSEGTESVYCKSMASLFQEIKFLCERPLIDDLNALLANFEERFDSLAKYSESQSRHVNFASQRRPDVRFITHLGHKVRDMSRAGRVHVLERFKLKPRLVRAHVPYPSSGDELALR